MTIADFWIKLGVKGGDSAKKTFQEVDKGINKIKGSSLAAKAAIVGVIYSLQRMSSSSANLGTSLNQFASSTGLSTKKLQEWQYAGQQFGISAEAIQSSVESVQGVVAKWRLGESTPAGMSQLLKLTDWDPNRAEDIFYTLSKLQELAQKTRTDIGKEWVTSFGAGALFAGMKEGNVFTEKNFKRAPIYGDQEIKNLAKVNAGWKNFFQRFNMSVGRLNAKFGPKLIGDLNKISIEFFKLIDAVVLLAKEMKFFEKIGTFIKNITNLIGLVQGLVSEKGVMGATTSALNAATGKSQGSVWWWPESWNTAMGYGAAGKMGSKVNHMGGIDWSKAGNPRNPQLPERRGDNQNGTIININQNFNNDGSNAKEIGEETKKAVNETYWKMPAQRQVT